jgi:hypothetical protein
MTSLVHLSAEQQELADRARRFADEALVPREVAAERGGAVRGLHRCWSATHGGGGLTGIAGYLGSRRILADRRWWRWGRS